MSPESVHTEVDPRTWRVLAESMTVLPESGYIHSVVGENGNGEYQVDAREGQCTCPDHNHREATCKHQRGVAYATGNRVIRGEVPRETIDELLGTHTADPVRVVASDGGAVVEKPEERPEDCDCGEWNDGLHASLAKPQQ